MTTSNIKSMTPSALWILSPGKCYYPISQVKKLRHSEATEMAHVLAATGELAKLSQDSN